VKDFPGADFMLIPPAGTNNLWYDYHADSDTVLIFIHGILSDSRAAWLYKGPPDIYWPDLLKSDRRVGNVSTYLAGYETGLNAGIYNVADCAAEVLNGLKLSDADGKPPVLSKSRLVFVCHSMGGIVVRDMLATYRNDFRNKKIGLVLIASPSYGSHQADHLKWAIKVYGNEQAQGLKWGNWRLEELDRQFSILQADTQRGFTLKGIEAVEQHYIIRPKSRFLPSFIREPVVPRESGARYYRPGEMMRNTDHFSIARPYSLEHPTHQLLVRFLIDFAENSTPSTNVLPPPATESFQQKPSQTVVLPERTSTVGASVTSLSPVEASQVRTNSLPVGVHLMREGMVYWLHISDFHIQDGDGYDRNVILKALVESLEPDQRPIDFIFATGDIAFSGRESQYEKATLFFNQLLAAAKLPKERLFVIPGNHDIDRDKAPDLVRTLVDIQAADSFFGNQDRVRRYTEKSKAFRDWYNRYFYGIRVWPEASTCPLLENVSLPKVNVAIALLDSSLFCMGDDDYAKLWIGRRCLDPVIDQVKNCQADIRIALIHHPFDWLHDGERSIVRTMIQDNFDVILRGHLHETDVEQVVGTQGTVLRIACGAAYQGSKWPNRVLYGRVNMQTGLIRIRPINFTSSPRSLWTLDTGVFPEKPFEYEGEFRIHGKDNSSIDPIWTDIWGPHDITPYRVGRGQILTRLGQTIGQVLESEEFGIGLLLFQGDLLMDSTDKFLLRLQFDNTAGVPRFLPIRENMWTYWNNNKQLEFSNFYQEGVDDPMGAQQADSTFEELRRQIIESVKGGGFQPITKDGTEVEKLQMLVKQLTFTHYFILHTLDGDTPVQELKDYLSHYFDSWRTLQDVRNLNGNPIQFLLFCRCDLDPLKNSSNTKKIQDAFRVVTQQRNSLSSPEDTLLVSLAGNNDGSRFVLGRLETLDEISRNDALKWFTEIYSKSIDRALEHGKINRNEAEILKQGAKEKIATLFSDENKLRMEKVEPVLEEIYARYQIVLGKSNS
jgi:3',5'-cyclic AMP phosphodiesterase CpdA/pimeloyl-ACP methyl ester carboxylesterase